MDSVPELELQQELERFTTRFYDRVAQASEILGNAPHQRVRDEALRRSLLYVSSATEIATGANPVVNLLDMVVFIRLSRTILERHWIPQLFGEAGGELTEAFATSDREVTEIAAQALTAAQRTQLSGLVEAWLAENPTQVRVEGIRLADFSKVAGKAAADRSVEAKGLLSSVKTASHAANQAFLLTERALFLVHRLPFLWRMQARLGAREVMSDTLGRLLDGPQAPVARIAENAKQLVRQGLTYAGLLGGAGVVLWRLAGPARR